MGWIIKKWALGKLNKALDGKDLTKKTETLQRWIARVKLVLLPLEAACKALEDGKLTEDEIEELKKNINKIVSER